MLCDSTGFARGIRCYYCAAAGAAIFRSERRFVVSQNVRDVPAVSLKTRIGWIGTGVMGRSMCQHLMKAGYAMTVFNRTRQSALPLLEKGALWVDSPREVAGNSDVVFTMVGFPEDVREVYLGKNGILEGARKGLILVDMTTTEPSLAEEIYQAALKREAFAVDAPVSGGDLGARNATLSIMTGGDQEVVQAVRPILEVMGRNCIFQGPAGAGQHAKMCNQIVITGTMIGVCESLIYGFKAGLDLPTMLRSIQGGAAKCWTLDNLAPRILERDFTPGFFVDHFIKDMAIALKEAARRGLFLPGLALVNQLYLAVKAQGHGRDGTQALILALEQMSRTEVRK
ncbi:MAG: NAD(P)-dependent oxidoreductase [Acidobacteria bacterium]|nr:NAD(P)-dependent oxidoreductase [Acidobacteriota bacterium]